MWWQRSSSVDLVWSKDLCKTLIHTLITRPSLGPALTEDEEAECDDMMAADISGDLEHVR